MDREALDPETVFFPGLDAAILGVGESYGNTEQIVAYSYRRMVEIFMERDGMTYEDACDWVDFNVSSQYLGKFTPFILFDKYDD